MTITVFKFIPFTPSEIIEIAYKSAEENKLTGFSEDKAS